MAASNGGHRRRRHGMWCASFFFHFSIWRGFKNSKSQRASAAARALTATPTALPHATCGVICTLTLIHSHTHTRYAPTFVAGTLTQFLCSGRCAALAAPPFVHPCPAPPRPCGSMLEFCRLVFLSLGDAAAKCQEVNT